MGVFLVWYSYHITSPEDRQEIFRYIQEADLFWIGMSVLLGIASHVSRAIRWNYLLEPLGYRPRLSNNIFIILIAYFTNLGIPRSGEILRATALATYEDVPFEKGFGTIVTERIIDVIMLLIIVFITLTLQTDIIMDLLLKRGMNLGNIFILLGIGVFGLILFFLFVKKSDRPFAKKIKGFVKGLMEGVLSVFKMKHKWAFIFHTLFIWTAYVGMFWVIKHTVPETMGLSLGQLLVAFVAGSFAITATNGGIGLYPIAVSSSLALFGISSVSGDAFGWIMWIAQTSMVVVFGAISFVVLPLWNRNR